MTKIDKFQTLFSKFEEYRINNKLRKTPERETLIREICDNLVKVKPHFEADELFAALIIKNTKISRATIFRNLRLFVEAGILRKSTLGENHSHYEVVLKNRCQHDHLICNQCGKVIEFSNKDIEKKIADITADNNFELVNHKFEIYGLCSECQDQNES